MKRTSKRNQGREWRWPIIALVLVFCCRLAVGQDPAGEDPERHLDADGRRYSLTVVSDPAFVGEESVLSAQAYHEDGVRHLVVVEDGDYLNAKTAFTCSSQSCLFEIPVSSVYRGQKSYEVQLWKQPRRYVTSFHHVIEFGCREEYCPPDARVSRFLSWMRRKGYTECLVERYAAFLANVEGKEALLPFIEERAPSSRLFQNHQIHFYDVIPTDTDATYTELGAGEAMTCERAVLWPEFCPTPAIADIEFLESHFRRTFGVDFEFSYHALPLHYAETFGEPSLTESNTYRFNESLSFLDSFEPHSIVHYAVETYRGLRVADMSGASDVARLGVEPYNVLGATTYTHEFGHTLGLPHPFTGFPRHYFQLDGIMSNTYGDGSPLLDPLDPLERYALEPLPDGFLDDETFAARYHGGIIGTSLLPRCEIADPAITDVRVSQFQDTVQFHVSITGYGTLEAHHVPLAVFAGALDSTPVVSRIIEKIVPDTEIIHQITLPSQSVKGPLFFVLSPEEEMNGDDPSNNRYIATIESGGPFRRGDANSDGAFDVSDPIYILLFLFRGRGEIPCMKAADVNDDGAVDIADGLTLLGVLFRGEDVRGGRFGHCGMDETPDELSCEEFGPCNVGA